jgi:plastocyanin
MAASPADSAQFVLTVTQIDRTFRPNKVTISAGAALLIKNDDRIAHHIYVDSDDMSYDSDEQQSGESVRLPFEKKGQFLVLCAIHPRMSLEVTVK